ncbi:hypothetical protein O0I10_005034 [Lichtheimia ornata]|uniref:Uncharacterized protein n=1 Tax=Lichtheimia ornata TaxID=688661 RepID=A0AAD7V4S9_9FUNG|nr:uncharacterized protein O0I10_005034 [Lichtheimia ornata]KAJ8659319.1 hypothetical protein O0I10_005034 [Lichtheimia ornata]
MMQQPIATRAEGMTTTITTHHPHHANPAFDNRRSRCISVPNAGWKVSMRTSTNDPLSMPSSSSSSSSSSQPAAATVNSPSYGSYPPFYHDNGPKVSSNDAFQMRKNHGRMMQHHHQRRPASFVGGFVVPPPLLHSHAPLVPQRPPQQQPSSSSSSTQLYQSSMTLPSNGPTTTTSHHHHPRSRAIPSTTSSNKRSLDSTKKQQQQQQPRRIRVQSVNEMHRVWIDVAPNETGYTLADKIHTIATFRTMKIVSITSAHGRPIPLTKQHVFTSWDDLQGFEDGEEWKVEWVPLERRNLVDRIMSRVVQS